MGILWEVVQTGLMYGQKRKSDSVEDRVQFLENQLTLTQNTLRDLVKKLEELHGLDIDGEALSLQRPTDGLGYFGRRAGIGAI